MKISFFYRRSKKAQLKRAFKYLVDGAKKRPGPKMK